MKEPCKMCLMPHDCKCECQTCVEARERMRADPEYTPLGAAMGAVRAKVLT